MDNAYLKKVKKEVDDFEQERLFIISTSAGMLKLAKRTIFALHADNFDLASDNLQKIQDILATLKNPLKKYPQLRYEGSLHAALEEYAESSAFYYYLKENKIKKSDDLLLNTEYLAGLCDFTGELVRKATLAVIKDNFNAVQDYYETTSFLVTNFLEFNFNSYLRTKFDQMKRNLKNLEQILYDLKIKKNH